MPTSVTVNDLKINELTEAQYDAAVQGGVIGENELSVITDLTDKAVQVSALPTASATELGNIYQYVGATDANYTNGYFYKATGTIVTVPGTITCTDVAGVVTITCSDPDGLVAAIQQYTGWETSSVVAYLSDPSATWGYNVDSDELGWSAYGVMPSAMLSYFSFSPALSSGDYVQWTTSNYVPSYQEVQNGAWEAINTQSIAPTTPSTMPTLLAANWSSSTQTVSVSGVTATNSVFVSPAPASAADYASAGIVCTAQGSGTLTFTCATTPTNDITVNVAIFG